MISKFILFFTIGLVVIMPAMGGAAMMSTNFHLKSSVVSGGGGLMGSPGYSMQSVLGQATPIMSQNNEPWSPNYLLYPGYLYTILISGCLWNLSGDYDVDGEDLNIFLLGYPGVFDVDDIPGFAKEFGKGDCF
ncbi:MAG: hypothetical protein GY699_06260 [Desulfobacteraceae bacterium]|nr:hypothetical protein [Desulfobacteraceae bacterium]